MRLRKPHPASLSEVTISRHRDEAVIRFREPGFVETHLALGSDACRMSDEQILEYFNETLREEERAVDETFVSVEIPAGERQIEYVEEARQWAPRGSVLRCVLDDSGPDREAVVYIDDQALPLAEFGKLLATYSGWGMRICFVPEERIAEAPVIRVTSAD